MSASSWVVEHAGPDVEGMPDPPPQPAATTQAINDAVKPAFMGPRMQREMDYNANGDQALTRTQSTQQKRKTRVRGG
jgi:hypothetical protein